MPAPSHVRLTYSGVFGAVGAPVDIWSMGLSLSHAGTLNVNTSVMQALADACFPLWATHLGSGIYASATLTECKAALVGDDGHVVRSPTGAYTQGIKTGSVAGAAAGSSVLQVALAVSLESGFSGPTGRGRFYIPTPSIGTITDGLFSTTQQTTWLNRAKAFCDAVNAAATTVADAELGRIVIASGGSASRGLDPTLHTVTRVRVGRRPDIQRRRANDVPEEYAVQTLA